MEAEDDPEARIRELERPLNEAARMSELGAAGQGGYGYPPPPPPPLTPPPLNYGAPFPMAPRRTTVGFAAGWIVFAVLAVGLLVLAGGVAAYVGLHRASGGGSIVIPSHLPSISGGNGSTTSPPSTRPRTSTNATPTPTAESPISTPPPGGQLSVSGIGENRTIACNDSFVSVSGFSNTVVITGHCAKLTVSGGNNVVTVDSADAIGASGFSNQVTYHSGSPRVDTSGESNMVEQG